MQRRLVKTKALTLIGAAALWCPDGARADAIVDLQAQIDALLKKVAALEQAEPARDAKAPGASAAGAAVTGGATPGSFKLPGSNTSVTIGGYVKLDAVASDRSAGVGSTADQELEASAVPVGPGAGANERNQVKLHARQSRLFAKTSTPSNWGEVTTYLEFDLFGANGNESVSNSHGLRVRHAYGTLGNLLVGQTWTTFSDPATYPETVDFGGPVGVIFARQAQVRWTQPFAGGQWSIALENPETVVALRNGDTFRADDDRFPDLTGQIKFTTAHGTYSVAGLARQLRVDSAAAPASTDQKWGAAVGVNGVIPVFHGDDVRVSAYYGNAIGRYSIGFFSDAVVAADAHLMLPNEWLAMAAYRHVWAPGLRSTWALSTLRASNPPATAGSVSRSAYSSHLNLIWSPIEKANLGLEYIRAGRTIESGQSGRLNRLQASAQFLF
jgi:hypothetical protein